MDRWLTRVGLLPLLAVLLTGCGGTDPGADAPEVVVEVPEDATVFTIRGTASNGDDEVALSASVHDRDGRREADVYLADLRVSEPREQLAVSGPVGTSGRVEGFEVLVVDIVEVEGDGDVEDDGAVREIVTVAVTDVAAGS